MQLQVVQTKCNKFHKFNVIMLPLILHLRPLIALLNVMRPKNNSTYKILTETLAITL